MGSDGVCATSLLLALCLANTFAGRQEHHTRRSEVPRRSYEWMQPLTYLENVTSLFAKRLREYGVGNLPVPDKVYDVNITRYKIHLLGSLDYSDGFVVSVQNITRHPRDYIWYIDEKTNNAIIQFKIEMTNISIFYDVRVDLEVLETPATCVLVFPTNHIQVLVYQNLTTQETGVLSMRTNSVSGPKTTYTPDSPAMKAVAYNARLTMSSSLFSDLTLWITNTLESILDTIVKEKAFPLKVKRGKRRPGRRQLLRRRTTRRPCEEQ